MTTAFDLRKHERRIYRLIKRMERAYNAKNIRMARLYCEALRRELNKRPAGVVAWMEIDKGLVV